jgi:hypothetical protein
MNLLIASLAQMALCLLSFFYLWALGPWAESRWIMIGFPLAAGAAWALVTRRILTRAGKKWPFIVVAALELPLAFPWPMWIALTALFGHL